MRETIPALPKTIVASIEKYARDAYAHIAQHKGISLSGVHVAAWCVDVTEDMHHMMKTSPIFDSIKMVSSGEIVTGYHQFLEVKIKGVLYIVDPTWKQVPIENKRAPNVMIVESSKIPLFCMKNRVGDIWSKREGIISQEDV